MFVQACTDALLMLKQLKDIVPDAVIYDTKMYQRQPCPSWAGAFPDERSYPITNPILLHCQAFADNFDSTSKSIIDVEEELRKKVFEVNALDPTLFAMITLSEEGCLQACASRLNVYPIW